MFCESWLAFPEADIVVCGNNSSRSIKSLKGSHLNEMENKRKYMLIVEKVSTSYGGKTDLQIHKSQPPYHLFPYLKYR